MKHITSTISSYHSLWIRYAERKGRNIGTRIHNLPKISPSLAAVSGSENTVVKILLYHDEPIAVELPVFMELKVVETDPGIRGDTASGGTKLAVVETGAAVKVPLYLEAGEVIKIDTRTRAYVERVR